MIYRRAVAIHGKKAILVPPPLQKYVAAWKLANVTELHPPGATEKAGRSFSLRHIPNLYCQLG
jgi:hypothetical protein